MEDRATTLAIRQDRYPTVSSGCLLLCGERWAMLRPSWLVWAIYRDRLSPTAPGPLSQPRPAFGLWADTSPIETETAKEAAFTPRGRASSVISRTITHGDSGHPDSFLDRGLGTQARRCRSPRGAISDEDLCRWRHYCRSPRRLSRERTRFSREGNPEPRVPQNHRSLQAPWRLSVGAGNGCRPWAH